MVENPLYEGPIYEVISENKKRKQLLPKTKVHAEESLYLDSPTQSMPRDCIPGYDTSGATVVANEVKEGDVMVKLEGLTTLESSLDHHHLQPNPYANTSSVDQATEDAYTLMCSAQPVASLTCHTNYLATSNGSGQYTMDLSSPYSSTSSHKQVTLV